MAIQSNIYYRPRFQTNNLKNNENLKTKIKNEKIKQLNINIGEFNKKTYSQLTLIPEDLNSLEKILAKLSQETANILNKDTKLTKEAKNYFSEILIDAYLICKCNKKEDKKEDKSLSRSQRFYYEKNTLNIKGNQNVNPKRSILSGYFKDAIILYNSIYRSQNINEQNYSISLEKEIKFKINISQYNQTSDNKENTPPNVAESKKNDDKNKDNTKKSQKNIHNDLKSENKPKNLKKTVRPVTIAKPKDESPPINKGKKPFSKGSTDESKNVTKIQTHKLNPENSNIAEPKSKVFEDQQAKVIADIERLNNFDETQKKEFLDFLIPIWEIQAKECTNDYDKKLLLKLIYELLLSRIDEFESLNPDSNISEVLCNKILEITNENTKKSINNAIYRYLKDLKDKN